jgi:carbamate kinase
MYQKDGSLEGVEVVIDKDRASSLLASQLNARVLILATDTDGVYLNWGTDKAKKLHKVTPEEIKQYDFETGTMGPKVEAACEFVNKTGERAVIGSLSELEKMISGDAGTQFVIR